MNGSKGYRAPGASEQPDRGEVVLSLKTVQKMLPLVSRIIDDILAQHKTLDRLLPQSERLERQRRNLDWPARQERYRLQEEVARAFEALDGAREEMDELGVVLLDPEVGRVGFPTLVNNRKAYFSWQPGEDSLHSWHFAEESQCRPIPPAWLKELGLIAKS